MEKLIEQLLKKGFKPAIFSIYNYIEDNGYLAEWEVMFNEKFSIDDFEYTYFDLPINIKNGLKHRNKEIVQSFNDFKKLIEVDLQDNDKKPMSLVIINKDGGTCILINQKRFDLIGKLKEKVG